VNNLTTLLGQLFENRMTLAEYLYCNNLTIEQFAAIIGRSKHGVHKWLNGQRKPRSAEMELIINATQGAVRADDFFPFGGDYMKDPESQRALASLRERSKATKDAAE
jgi:transcriptional regulator with XRE-family HTH domain